MIVFRGWAWAIVPVSLLIMWFAVSHSFSAEYLESHRWPYSLGILICAPVVFLFGRHIHEGCPLADLMDQDDTHSLMFIPVEYWGILLAIVSVMHISGAWQWLMRILNLH